MAYDKYRKNLFRRILFIVLISGAVVVIGFIVFLQFKLYSYEKSQPDNLAKDIFESYFLNKSEKNLLSLITSSNTDAEEEQALKSQLSDILSGGELSYKRAETDIENGHQKYIVYAGDQSLISFMLKRVPDTERHIFLGFLTLKYCDYELGQFENEMVSNSKAENAETVYTVTAPSGYSVYANGVFLEWADVIENNIPLDAAPYAPEGMYPPTLLKYSFKSKASNSKVTAKNPQGINANVTYDEITKSYSVEYIYSYELYSRYEQDIITQAEAYIRYLQNDLDFTYAEPYIDSTSPFYAKIRDSHFLTTIPHTGFEFTNESTDMYIQWNESIFSCMITLDSVLHNTGGEDYIDNINMMFFFRIEGENILIYDIFNVN